MVYTSNPFNYQHSTMSQSSDKREHPLRNEIHYENKGAYPLTRGDSMASDNSSNQDSYQGGQNEDYDAEGPLGYENNKGVKKRHVTNLAPEEKRQRRLMRNRVAAKECRRKKKLYVEELERKAEMLEIQNQRLNFELKELNAKLTLGLMRYQVIHGVKLPRNIA